MEGLMSTSKKRSLATGEKVTGENIAITVYRKNNFHLFKIEHFSSLFFHHGKFNPFTRSGKEAADNLEQTP